MSNNNNGNNNRNQPVAATVVTQATAFTPEVPVAQLEPAVDPVKAALIVVLEILGIAAKMGAVARYHEDTIKATLETLK